MMKCFFQGRRPLSVLATAYPVVEGRRLIKRHSGKTVAFTYQFPIVWNFAQNSRKSESRTAGELLAYTGTQHIPNGGLLFPLSGGAGWVWLSQNADV
jgi:hypothetical protein